MHGAKTPTKASEAASLAASSIPRQVRVEARASPGGSPEESTRTTWER